MIQLAVTLVSVLVAGVQANLKIFAPASVATKYRNTDFKHHISSFGRVPYGHTVLGNLRIPFPENACGPTVSVDYTDPDPLILVIPRGNCSFLEKVQNGQKLKAALVIIVDDRYENMAGVIPWAENATELDVRIPSLVIEQQKGEALLDDIRFLSSVDKSRSVMASFEFKIVQMHTSDVHYKFDLDSRPLYESFTGIFKFYQNLKDRIRLFPIYNIKNLGEFNDPQDKPFCLNQTLFCQLRRDKKQVAPVDQPIFESIRQLCLSVEDLSNWWKYVSHFYQRCQKKREDNTTELIPELKKCSDEIIEEMSRDDPNVKGRLDTCMSNLTEQSVKGGSLLQEYLQSNYRNRTMTSSPVEPTIMINGQLLYGRIESIDVLKEICASLLNKPGECEQIDKMKVVEFPRSEPLGFWRAMYYLLKLVLIGMIATAAFYFIYKLKLRKDMEKKLNSEVDNALADYYMKNKSMKASYDATKLDDTSIDTSRGLGVDDDLED